MPVFGGGCNDGSGRRIQLHAIVERCPGNAGEVVTEGFAAGRVEADSAGRFAGFFGLVIREGASRKVCDLIALSVPAVLRFRLQRFVDLLAARRLVGCLGRQQGRAAAGGLEAALGAISKRAGLDGVGLHDLRHTHASFGAGPAFSCRSLASYSDTNKAT